MAPLTDAMNDALVVLLTEPVAFTGPSLEQSRWTWRTPSGRTVPMHTLNGLMRRRLVKSGFHNGAALTDAGRRTAQQIAQLRAFHQNRRAS